MRIRGSQSVENNQNFDLISNQLIDSMVTGNSFVRNVNPTFYASGQPKKRVPLDPKFLHTIADVKEAIRQCETLMFRRNFNGLNGAEEQERNPLMDKLEDKGANVIQRHKNLLVRLSELYAAEEREQHAERDTGVLETKMICSRTEERVQAEEKKSSDCTKQETFTPRAVDLTKELRHIFSDRLSTKEIENLATGNSLPSLNLDVDSEFEYNQYDPKQDKYVIGIGEGARTGIGSPYYPYSNACTADSSVKTLNSDAESRKITLKLSSAEESKSSETKFRLLQEEIARERALRMEIRLQKNNL